MNIPTYQEDPGYWDNKAKQLGTIAWYGLCTTGKCAMCKTKFNIEPHLPQKEIEKIWAAYKFHLVSTHGFPMDLLDLNMEIKK